MAVTVSNGVEPAELTRIRRRIDDIDARLVELMVERLRLADETLEVKRCLGLPPVDVGREARVVARGARLARERGLDVELVRDIFWRLIEVSRSSHGAAGVP